MIERRCLWYPDGVSRSGFVCAIMATRCALGCASSPALFAGWEPMNLAIPKVANADVALRRLDQSRALWRAFRAQLLDDRSGLRVEQVPGKYSYVRAHQLAKDRVEFTLFMVDAQDRVGLRALISTDPARIERAPLWKRSTWRSFESRWVERGPDVGKHPDGAVARSIDGLYDDCATLIRQHPSVPVRLYFHPDGVLMQCGFAAADCSGCGEVSVQAYSHFPIDAAILSDDPAKWVCSAGWGAVLPDSPVPLVGDLMTCTASARAPHARPIASTTHPGAGSEDICRIDPAACPDLYPDGDSFWNPRPTVCARYPEHDPGPLDTGKAEPRGPWQFKFTKPYAIECNND